MPLAAATLAGELEKLSTEGTDGEKLQRVVDAWEAFFNEATVNGVPVNPGTLSGALAAMASALVGMGAVGQAATKLQAGIAAFWSTLAPTATAVWTTAPMVLVPPIIPPATVSGIAAALTPVFSSNTSGMVSKAVAAQNIAAVLYSNGGIGATVPGSIPPAPPVAVPIL